jgi:Domain of unknown function (DUF4328)/Protein of unknown function (DUF2510)
VSEHSGYPGAPPGWYEDPAGGPGQRWWDGYTWTESTVLPQQPPPPPSWASAAPPQQAPSQIAPWAAASERLNTFAATQAVEDEQRIGRWGRFAVAIPGVYFLVSLLLQRVNTTQLLSAGHQLRLDWDAAQADKSTPVYHPPANSWAPIGVLALALTIAAVIVACVWQHRAATAARALDIPSRYSPAWGVGCWFVPIVNLWMPYGAIRACLPEGHPYRTHVLRWWLALMCTWVLSVAAGTAALFSTGAGLALAIPAALACLSVIAWAPGIVAAIATSHQQLLAARTGEIGVSTTESTLR